MLLVACPMTVVVAALVGTPLERGCVVCFGRDEEDIHFSTVCLQYFPLHYINTYLEEDKCTN